MGQHRFCRTSGAFGRNGTLTLGTNEDQALNSVMYLEVCFLGSLCGEDVERGSREARPGKCRLLL